MSWRPTLTSRPSDCPVPMLSTLLCRLLHLLLLASIVLAAKDFYKELGGASARNRGEAPTYCSRHPSGMLTLSSPFLMTPAVDRQANDATIKKAYRKIAKANHPDKNKDPAAQQKFADASAGASHGADTHLPLGAVELTCILTWRVSSSVRGPDGLGSAFRRCACVSCRC